MTIILFQKIYFFKQNIAVFVGAFLIIRTKKEEKKINFCGRYHLKMSSFYIYCCSGHAIIFLALMVLTIYCTVLKVTKQTKKHQILKEGWSWPNIRLGRLIAGIAMLYIVVIRIVPILNLETSRHLPSAQASHHSIFYEGSA